MLYAWSKPHITLSILLLLYSSNCYSDTLSDTIKAEEAGHRPHSKFIEKIKRTEVKTGKKIVEQAQISPATITNGKVTPNRSNPKVANLYEGLEQKIKQHRLDPENKDSPYDTNGIDLALKQLASEFEKQFLAIMWQFASTGVSSGHGFGIDVWQSELNHSIIDAGYDLGEIGQDIYEELKRNILEQNGEILDGPGKTEQINSSVAKGSTIFNEKGQKAIAKGK